METACHVEYVSWDIITSIVYWSRWLRHCSIGGSFFQFLNWAKPFRLLRFLKKIYLKPKKKNLEENEIAKKKALKKKSLKVLRSILRMCSYYVTPTCMPSSVTDGSFSRVTEVYQITQDYAILNTSKKSRKIMSFSTHVNISYYAKIKCATVLRGTHM